MGVSSSSNAVAWMTATFLKITSVKWLLPAILQSPTASILLLDWFAVQNDQAPWKLAYRNVKCIRVLRLGQCPQLPKFDGKLRADVGPLSVYKARKLDLWHWEGETNHWWCHSTYLYTHKYTFYLTVSEELEDKNCRTILALILPCTAHTIIPSMLYYCSVNWLQLTGVVTTWHISKCFIHNHQITLLSNKCLDHLVVLNPLCCPCASMSPEKLVNTINQEINLCLSNTFSLKCQ